MRRLFCLIAMSLVGIACSKALQVGGTDAGRDSVPIECVGPPPDDACGYNCQNGRWVRIPLLCLVPDAAGPDSAIPDSATPDSATADSAIPDVPRKDAYEVGPQVTDTDGTLIPDGPGAQHDADPSAACANIARTWLLGGSCMGPHATFNGAFTAQMAQTGCKLTFTQTDDNTSTQWTATGALESNGRGYLKGAFGFTDSSMCDLTVTATGWSMICSSATQQCKLEARPVPDLY